MKCSYTGWSRKKLYKVLQTVTFEPFRTIHHTITLFAPQCLAEITYCYTQPFYSSLDFVQDNPGELVPEGTFCHLLDFLGQNEDNTGRHTNNPDKLAQRHPIQTNWCPYLCHPHHFYALPFLVQPSQFILAWDRHQICWLACPVAWLDYLMLINTKFLYMIKYYLLNSRKPLHISRMVCHPACRTD